MQFRSFLKIATGVGTLSLVNKGTGILITILLARWLGPESLGIYAFSISIMTLVLIPVKLGLPEFLLREISATIAKGLEKSARKLALKAILIVALLSASIILSALFLSEYFFQGEYEKYKPAIYVCLFLIPILAFTSIFEHIIRAYGRAINAYALAELFPTLLSLVFLIFVAFSEITNIDATTGLYTRVAGGSICLALIVLSAFKSLPQREAPETEYNLNAILSAAMPFALISVAGTIMSRIDVTMLGVMVNTKAVGLYNVAVQGALIVAFFHQIGTGIVAPEFSKLYSKQNVQRLQKLAVSTARLFTLGAFIATAAIVFLGTIFIEVLFGIAYVDAIDALIILACGQMLSSVFGSPGMLLSMTGHQKVTLWLTIIAAIFNFFLNLLLIPNYGLIGASIATSVTLILWKLLACFYVKLYVRINCSAFG